MISHVHIIYKYSKGVETSFQLNWSKLWQSTNNVTAGTKLYMVVAHCGKPKDTTSANIWWTGLLVTAVPLNVACLS